MCAQGTESNLFQLSWSPCASYDSGNSIDLSDGYPDNKFDTQINASYLYVCVFVCAFYPCRAQPRACCCLTQLTFWTALEQKTKQHNIVTVRQGTGLAFLLPSLPSRSVLENPLGPNQPENLHKDRSSRPPGWAGGSGWCGIKRLTNLFCPAAHSLSLAVWGTGKCFASLASGKGAALPIWSSCSGCRLLR